MKENEGKTVETEPVSDKPNLESNTSLTETEKRAREAKEEADLIRRNRDGKGHSFGL